jgi:hypothetical protein
LTGVDLEIDDARRWRPEDAEVVVTAQDPAHHLGGGALLEGEPDRWVALEEPGEALRKPASADRVEEGDADPSALRRDSAFGLGDGVAKIVEDAFGAPHQATSGLGETDVPADPLEEENPDLLLQTSHFSGDG